MSTELLRFEAVICPVDAAALTFAYAYVRIISVRGVGTRRFQAEPSHRLADKAHWDVGRVASNAVARLRVQIVSSRQPLFNCLPGAYCGFGTVQFRLQSHRVLSLMRCAAIMWQR